MCFLSPKMSGNSEEEHSIDSEDGEHKQKELKVRQGKKMRMRTSQPKPLKNPISSDEKKDTSNQHSK